MADIGKWGGLQIRIDLPPEIRDFIESVDTIFQIAITALDIALTVLNVVKAFVSGLLNIVRQLVQELIQFLKNLLLDFRQVGLYAHFGDLDLLVQDSTRDSLRGGYAGYQNRMITRLTDRNDPTRPNVSSSSAVVALFFYVGVDLTFIDQLRDLSQFSVLMDLVNGVAALFGANPPFGSQSGLPVPSNVEPYYAQATSRLSEGDSGSGSAALLLASSLVGGRNSVAVRWNLSPAPSSVPNSNPVVPPDGFLVEVSCFPQGLYAGWLAPVESSTGGEGGDGAQSYTAGFYTNSQTQEPLQIFGGVDSILISDEIRWDGSFDDEGNLVPGARPMFFTEGLTSTKILNPDVIQVRDDGKYINQRTFYVDHSTVRAQTWGTSGNYFINIPFDQLPLRAVPDDEGEIDPGSATVPDQVWVRVLSCDNKIISESSFKWGPQPHRTPEDTAVEPILSFSLDGDIVTTSSRSTPSDVITVMISNPSTDQCMLGIQAALTLALLSRSDLVPPSPATTGFPTGDLQGYRPTGLESVATRLLPVVINDVRSYFREAGVGPVAFSNDLRNKVVAMSQFLVESQGNLPPTLLATLSPTITNLVEWTWKKTTVTGRVADESFSVPDTIFTIPIRENDALDYTLLDVLNQGGERNGNTIPCVVTKNIRCISDPEGTLVAQPEVQAEVAESEILIKYSAGSFGGSSILDVSDSAPVLQDGTGQLWYVRDIVPSSVYDDARTILQVAGAPTGQPQEGAWLNWRPFAGVNSDFIGINNLIADIERWASFLDSGLQGIADQILAYIDAIEQRILEIQELIRRIQRYLAIPLSITIPDALLLPLIVSGVDGVVAGLASSQNQPDDGPNVYSGGVVVLAGGLPTIVFELLKAAIDAAG